MEYRQFLQKFRNRNYVDISILKMHTPVLFTVKEVLSSQCTEEARSFVQLEQLMNNHYKTFEETMIEIPSSGTLIALFLNDEWYRGRVESVLETTVGVRVSAYLVDYGKIVKVEKAFIRKPIPEMMEVPYQAVTFAIPNLKPCSLVMKIDASVSSGMTETWDVAAIEYVRLIICKNSCARMNVVAIDLDNVVYGTLMVNIDGDFVNLNEELLFHKYACLSFQENSFNSVDTQLLPLKNNEEIHFDSLESYFESKKLRKEKKLTELKFLQHSLENFDAKSDTSSVKSLLSPRAFSNFKETTDSHQKIKYSTKCRNTREYESDYFSKPQGKQSSPINNKQSILLSSLYDKIHIYRMNENKLVTGNFKNKMMEDDKDQVNLESKNVITSAQSNGHLATYHKGIVSSVQNNQFNADTKNIIDPNDNKNKSKNLETFSELKMPVDLPLKVDIETAQTPLSFNDKEIYDGQCQSKMTLLQKLIKAKTINTQSSMLKSDKHNSVVCTLGLRTNLAKDDNEKALPVPVEPLITSKNHTDVKHLKDKYENKEDVTKSVGKINHLKLLLHKINAPESGLYNEKPYCDISLNKNEKLTKYLGGNNDNLIDVTKSMNLPMPLSNKTDSVFNKSIETKTLSDNTLTDKGLQKSHLEEVPESDFSEDFNKINGSRPIENSIYMFQCNKIDNLKTSILSNDLKESDFSKDPNKINNSAEHGVNAPQCNKTDRQTSPISSKDLKKLLSRIKSPNSNSSKCDISMQKSNNSSLCGSPNLPESDTKKFAEKNEDIGVFSLNSLPIREVNPNVSIHFNTNMKWEGAPWGKDYLIRSIRHGKCIPKPMRSISSAPFSSDVMKALRNMHFPGPTAVQSLMWPAIFRGCNAVSIATPHSGKTFGYLLPLLSNLLQSSLYEGLPVSGGPLALILCSSWKKAQTVHDHCRILLETCNKINVLVMYGGGCETLQKFSLINGCDLLIATPPCLLRLLNGECKIANLQRCCHLIIDDGDIILDTFRDEIAEIIKQYTIDFHSRKNHNVLHQTIVCSAHWNDVILSFVHHCMLDPLVFITSFFEAAVYARVPTYCRVRSKSQIFSDILDILEGCDGKRVVICTSNDKNAYDIYKFVQSIAIYTLLLLSSMPHYDMDSVIREWKSVCSPNTTVVLVITDNILLDVDVSNANCVIQCDVEAISRSDFSMRYSCMVDNFCSLQDVKDGKVSNCICYILINEDIQPFANCLLRLLRRLPSKVSERLVLMADEREKQLAQSRTELCDFLKSLGYCPNKNHCKKRHKIQNFDDVTDLPRNGRVKVLVTHVIDAVHYYGRIIEVNNPDNICERSPSSYLTLSLKLAEYYSLEKNCVLQSALEIGKICVVEKQGHTYHRVQIIDIVQNSCTGKPLKLSVHYLDEGWNETVDVHRLFKIPSDLTTYASQAVEIFICDIQPIDKCYEWTPQSNTFVHNMISDKEMTGKIVLTLGNTMWLNPFVHCVQYEKSKLYLNEGKVSCSLIKNGFAIMNSDHMKNLYALCEGVTTLYAKLEIIKTVPNKITQKVAWAYLEFDEMHEVFVFAVHNPQLFFIQKDKFVNQVDEISNDFEKLVNQQKLSKLHSFQKGLICVALFNDDNKWYRARIDDIPVYDGSELQEEITLFFVDFGDVRVTSKNNLYAIPEKYLLLPFQAIECSLASISPVEGEWTCRAGDVFNDMTLDADVKKLLLAKVVERKSSFYTEGSRYTVELWDGNLNLANELTKQGIAVSTSRLSQNDATTQEIAFSDLSSEKVTNPVYAFCDQLESKINENNNETNSTKQVDFNQVLCITSDKMSKNINSEDISELDAIPKLELARQTLCITSDKTSKNIKAEDISEIDAIPKLEFARRTLCITTDKTSKKIKSGDISEIDAIPKLELLAGSQSLDQCNLLRFSNDVPNLECSKVEENITYLTPTVLWQQNNAEVIASVQLVGVNKYDISCGKKNVCFIAKVNENCYKFEEDLFSLIDSDQTKVIVTGRSVQLKFKKSQPGENWKNLIISSQKKPNIKADLEHLCEDYGKVCFNEIKNKKNYSGEEIIPFDTYLDDEEGDDEDDESEDENRRDFIGTDN